MAKWYIGIDEHGDFNPSEPENDSYVCAVLTQADGTERKKAFYDTYRILNGSGILEEKELLKYFHGINYGKEYRADILSKFWELNPNVIKKIVVTRGRPYVVSNAQQWWVMAVQSILFKILSSNLFAKDDKINISIATRKIEFVGFYHPSMIPNADNDDTAKDAYYELHEKYHEFLQTDIQRWLHSKYSKNITVVCKSASASTLVTLADQATNMALPFFRENLPKDILEEIPCQSFLPDGDCKSILQSGDILGATTLFLNDYYINKKTDITDFAKDIVDGLNQKGTEDMKTKGWEMIIGESRKALNLRGKDGLAINRVSHLKKYLNEEIDAHGLPSDIQIQYYGLMSAFYAHSGVVKLDDFDSMEKCVKGSKNYSNPYEQWQNYLNLQLFKAQSLFNNYNFNIDFLEKILNIQTEISKNATKGMEITGSLIDDNLAAIFGTLGQAAAFRGEYENALNFFFKDYNCTSDFYKSQVASYIVVVYHKLEKWDEACEWFEKQAGESFESFGNSLNQSASQWTVLNYLRLYALGLKLGKALPNLPHWKTFQREGDYPYGLILKWLGVCYYLMKNRLASKEMERAYGQLFMKENFTINSLALPVLKTGYKIADYGESEIYEEAYKNLLEKCCKSESFTKFIANKEVFDLHSKFDIWETAMMLPFNYA